MHGKTKIVVLHLKELLYTALLILAIVTLIILMIIMFKPSGKKDAAASAYTPGVYTSSITLGGQPMEIELSVDADHISNIRLRNLSESITTMYPYLETSFDDLANQICETQSLENISYNDDMRYTSMLLLEAIEQALNKASVSENKAAAKHLL